LEGEIAFYLSFRNRILLPKLISQSHSVPKIIYSEVGMYTGTILGILRILLGFMKDVSKELLSLREGALQQAALKSKRWTSEYCF
jgi:hypothetical protein